MTKLNDAHEKIMFLKVTNENLWKGVSKVKEIQDEWR